MRDPLCGSYAGLSRHKTRKEQPCDACLAAGADYQRQYRATREGAKEQVRWWRRTRDRALIQLSREFPARYLAILYEIREADPIPPLPPKS